MKMPNSNLTSVLFVLFVALLATGCAPQATVRSDNFSGGSSSNPLYNTSYSKEADVEFVMGSKAAKTYVSNKAFASSRDRFKSRSASRRTRDMVDWVLRTRDNRNKPFVVIDKVNAKAYAFSPSGDLYEAAPVLLGLGRGDHSVPGIGNKPLSQIPVADRTTPAGRFDAVIGRNHKGKEILWVDYDLALSLHPVVTGNKRERRAQRLASITSSDNRISFGCINVPKPFFKNVISKKYSGKGSVVYIMPETRRFGKS